MARRQPEGPPPPPVVARIRIRYAKRGRLRFASHRDFARAFERALRRAEIPMGYSAGFSPHPRISYVGASPTGSGSEAEYLEIGLAAAMSAERVGAALDAALPPGFDILEAVAAGPGSLAERITGSRWNVELPGVDEDTAVSAVRLFLAESSVLVDRLTKDGHRSIDARGAVVSIAVSGNGGGSVAADGPDPAPRAILDMVVRHASPSVRPDDVLVALRAVAGLALDAPPRAVRLAQGPLDSAGAIGDPLAADRQAHGTTP